MTIAEVMEVRYLRAEKEKELVGWGSSCSIDCLLAMSRATLLSVAETMKQRFNTITLLILWSPKCHTISSILLQHI